MDATVVEESATLLQAIRAGARHSTSIVTALNFPASRKRVWDGLMFYEQVAQPPALPLRWLLPRAIGIEGRKSAVGDLAKCLYDRGYLLKRVARIDEPRYYGFEVAEQALALGGGITLTSGCYRLVTLRDGGTRVAITTRYIGGRRPRWLWRPVEAAVCHTFHRHLLNAMRRALESRDRRRARRESE